MSYPHNPKTERVTFDHRAEAMAALSSHLGKQFDSIAVKTWARTLENAILGRSIASRYQEKYYSVDPKTGRRGKGWEEIGLAWSKWKQLEEELLGSQE